MTDAELAEFDVQMARWQARLGLLDWRVERGAKLAKKCMAEVDRDLVNRLATYRVGDAFGAVTPHKTESTAVHELLHVLLADLADMARGEPAHADVVMTAEHRVINVLEKLLVPKP